MRRTSGCSSHRRLPGCATGCRDGERIPWDADPLAERFASFGLQATGHASQIDVLRGSFDDEVVPFDEQALGDSLTESGLEWE